MRRGESGQGNSTEDKLDLGQGNKSSPGGQEGLGRVGWTRATPGGMERPGVLRELQRAWCSRSKVAAKEVEIKQERSGLCLLLRPPTIAF